MYNWVGAVECFFVFLFIKGFARLTNTFVSFCCCICAWLGPFVYRVLGELSTVLLPPTITTKIYI